MSKIKKQGMRQTRLYSFFKFSSAALFVVFSQTAQAGEVGNYYVFQSDIEETSAVRPDSFLPVMSVRSFADKTRNTQQEGFKGYSKGGEAAVGLHLNENFSTVLGYTYAATDLKQNGRKNKIDGNTYYISGKYQPAKWYVSGKIAYTRSSYNDKTSNQAETHGDVYRGELLSGYDLGNVHNYSGVKYTSAHTDLKNNAAFAAPKHNGEVITAVIGTKYGKAYRPAENAFIKPTLWLSGNYDIKSNTKQAVVDIPETSAVYVINGHRLHRASLDGGVGFGVGFKKIEASAGYGVNWRVGQFSQTGKVSLGVHF